MKIEDVTKENVVKFEKSELFNLRNQLNGIYISNFWEKAELILTEIDRRQYKRFHKRIDRAFVTRQNQHASLDSMDKVGKIADQETNHHILFATDNVLVHLGHRLHRLDLKKGIEALFCEDCGIAAAYIFTKDLWGWTAEMGKSWIDQRKMVQKAQAVPEAINSDRVTPN